MSLLNPNEKASTLEVKESLQKQQHLTNAKSKFFPGAEKILVKKEINIFSKILIDIDSTFKMIWDGMIISLSIILSIVIPYSISFFHDINTNYWPVICAIFGLDILLSFNISYYTEGIRIDTRKRIALHYIQNYFFLDLLAGFPFEYFFFDELSVNEDWIRAYRTGNELMRLLLLLKLLKLYKIPEFVYQIQIHYPDPFIYTFMNLLSYLLLALLPAHWMACIFNILYAYAIENSSTYSTLVISDNGSRFLKFYEKVIETMTSVGYGEFVSRTHYEQIFNIFVMCLTSGFLGVFVGAFILAIEKSIETTIFFQQATEKFSKFNNRHKIPLSLRMRISQYIRYLKSSINNNLLKEEDIIRLLSIPLRDQIFLITRGYLLIKIPQFQELSRGFLQSLGYIMNLQFYAPGDLIIREGEFTSDVYFIFSGNVEVHHEATDTTFIKLSKHAYFGEISFFRNAERTASVICITFSEIFSLTRDSFDNILQAMPRDFEIIQTLQRNLHTYGLFFLGIKCYICKKIGHVAKDCKSSTCGIDMIDIMHLAQERRLMRMKNQHKRQESKCKMLKGYKIANTVGREFKERESFKERKYLSKRVSQYNYSVRSVNQENNKLFTLINEFSDVNSREDKSDDSDESEKNFFNFSLSLMYRRPSQIVIDNPNFLIVEDRD